MKAFFLNIPAHGHVNPTLPLSREILKTGDVILYYNFSEFRSKIESFGIEFRPYPELDRSGIESENPIELISAIYKVTEELLPFLLKEVEREKPDYLIHDSLSLWGWILARITNLPSICSTTSFAMGYPVFEALTDFPFSVFRNFWQGRKKLLDLLLRRRRMRKVYNLPKRAIVDHIINSGDLNFVYTSKEFQPVYEEFEDQYEFIGPSVPVSQDSGDFPLDRLGTSKTIYISLGTLRNQRIDFYNSCIQEFQNSPYTIILSIGRNTQPEDLIAVPENFIIKQSVPQIEVLKKTDLFISHGGMNSVMESLYYGVPLLVYPQTDEQAMVGRQVERLGAGLVLQEKESKKGIRIQSEKILGDPIYLKNAKDQETYLRGAGGLEKAIEKLEEFKKNKIPSL